MQANISNKTVSVLLINAMLKVFKPKRAISPKVKRIFGSFTKTTVISCQHLKIKELVI